MRETPPQTKLGAAAAKASAPKAELTKFAKAALGARVFEPYRIPRLDVDVVITLVPHHRVTQIESDVIEYMLRKLQIEENATTELDYEAERAAQHLVDAFLDPTTKEPVGTLADWRDLDRDIISECWRQYAAVRVTYDPVSQPLSDGDIALIEETLKKKAEDPDRTLRLLRLFGIRRLSIYLLHSADRLLASATPTFSGSQSVEAGSES